MKRSRGGPSSTVAVLVFVHLPAGGRTAAANGDGDGGPTAPAVTPATARGRQTPC